MNSDALDKWLQKNVSHAEDQPTKKEESTDKQQNTGKQRRPKHKPNDKKHSDKRSHSKPAARTDESHKTKAKKHSGNKPYSKSANKPHSGRKNHKPAARAKNTQQNSPKGNVKNPAHTPKGPKKVRIIPLGGLNEVGKNMMAIEYGDDIVIIDMGLQFPEEDMLGVDYIVPDITYLQDNQHKIRGILITHAHLDHIGAIPYLSPKLNNPTFYGLKLTMGMVEQRNKEFVATKGAKLITVKPRQKLKLGVFTASFFRVNHSIPDSCGVIIDTPEGKIVHTGDFKFDFTPADGIQCDTETMDQLGKENVLALLSDSTNSTKPGHTMSEKVVGETLEEIIGNTQGRLIIASFASLIGRMQQIIDAAKKHNRQVFVTGRSMIQNTKMATKLGYLKYPKDLVKDLRKNSKAAQQSNALIITTGSQGESLAALTRMAMNEHATVKISKNDTIVYSSSPIVGNERAVYAVVNELTRKGANVISNKVMDVHTSGHGQQEDLKMMLNKIKPKFLIPVHGEYYMRHAHTKLAQECGIPADNCILADNGSIIECYKGKVSLSTDTVEAGYIMLDNQSGSISDIASHILSERQAMALNGIITPIIVVDKKTQKSIRSFTENHGFIFMRETEKVLQEVNREARNAYDYYQKNKKGKIDREKATTYIKGQVDRKITNRLERRPLTNPVILEV